jgi:hypothetical protein
MKKSIHLTHRFQNKNPMKKRFLILTYVLTFSVSFLFLQSCSGPSLEERNASEAHSSLIQSDKTIVAFGHVTVLDILNKMDYTSNSKTQVLIGGIVDQWKAGIDLSKPFYVSAAAPIAQDGSPETMHVIMDVKDAKKMDDVLAEMGYALEKEGDLKYFQDNDVTFGMIHKLLVIIIKKNEYDGKKELLATIEKMSGDLSEGKTKTIIDTKADIVTGINFERLFATSNTSLKNLSEGKKKELEETIADSYLQTAIKFETGQLSIESKHLFSDKFQKRLFFKDNNGTSLTSKLKGSPWMAGAANLDVLKIESFLKDFAPDAMKKITGKMPREVGFGLMALGDNPLSKLFNGQFAYSVYGQPEVGKQPVFMTYVGYGKQGQIIGEMANSSLKDPKMASNPLLPQVQSSKSAMVLTSKGFSEANSFKAPGFAPNFGENTASFYLDFKQVNWEAYELKDAQKVITTFDYLTVDANKSGSKVILKSKETNKNILKSMFDFYADMMMEKMGM